MIRRLSIIASFAIFLSAPVWASEFDDLVQPLLKTRCVRCHGPNDPKANLNLSTASSLVIGGDSGPVIDQANLEDSLLWQRVSSDEMPPEQPLAAAEKDLLRKWIAGGAQGINSSPANATEHWAFRKLSRPLAPAVNAAERVRTEMDCFIQAALEARGLSMNSDADRSALVRRASIDLTGLPPAPEEVDQFLSDPAEDAFERMIDRYLASPKFGERWGKHWLDAAGYADSNGYFSADTDRPLAYRYRDYVIRSLNADKPFDRFLREQLAGDEMSGFRAGQPTTLEVVELLEATHFLRNGQDGTDIGVTEPEAFEIDRRAALEAVVQVTASSLLGLTVQCARCHDHKFEPITQNEYYQFQAILFPAFNPQDWINPKDRIAYAYLPGEKETWEEDQRRLTEQLAALRNEYMDWLAANREPAEPIFHDAFEDDAWKTRWSSTAPSDDHAGGEVALDSSAANAVRVENHALQVIVGPKEAWFSTVMSFDWTPDATGDWIQASFDLVDNKVGGGPAERIGYTIAAHDFDDSSSTSGGNLLIDGNPSAATSLYADYPGADQKIIGQIGERGYAPGLNYGVRITNIGDGKFRVEHLVDGLTDGRSLELAAADLPNGGFAFFFSASRSFVVDNVRVERSLPASQTPADVAELRKRIEARRKEYNEQRGKLEAQKTPQPGRAIAWVTDKSATPPLVPFLTRGVYQLRGQAVEPAALKVLTDSGREYRPLPECSTAPTTGRRLGFAEWLTQSNGRPAGLVARVHTNRIWQQYFGRGIVATTDNLGQSGSPPTHPELLETMSFEFLSREWSQKTFHRKLVLSSVYRQSSATRPEALESDPDNRYYWRRPIRRLEAEVIRDGMLAVSGLLNETPYGPYVATEQTPIGEVIVDHKKPGASRRSVYLQQKRSQTLSLLKVFDAPAVATVCTTRPSSTVPLQSLALLNSEFAIQCSDAFANRLLSETDHSSPQLIQRAWQLALGRNPTDAEAELATEFLDAQPSEYTGGDSRARSLADLCQMLLASNAFLYVE